MCRAKNVGVSGDDAGTAACGEIAHRLGIALKPGEEIEIDDDLLFGRAQDVEGFVQRGKAGGQKVNDTRRRCDRKREVRG